MYLHEPLDLLKLAGKRPLSALETFINIFKTITTNTSKHLNRSMTSSKELSFYF